MTDSQLARLLLVAAVYDRRRSMPKRLQRLEQIYKPNSVFYLTLTTHDRKWLLGNRKIHEAFVVFARKAALYGVTVGRYVLMPDHMHLFAAFNPEALSLSNWVKSLKNSLSKRLRKEGHVAPHFQKDFFDHVLRTDESYRKKSEYMWLNPVRAGLVEDPEGWEFKGEIFPLDDCLED